MRPVAASVGMVLVAMVLASNWSCNRRTKADAESQPALPSNVVDIQPASQEAGGFIFAKVRTRRMPVTTTAVGSLTVDEDRTDHIGVLYQGVVTEVFAKVGDHVARGQVLARLHTHDLHDAISGYRTALAEAERTRRLTQYTLHNRERYESLYRIKFASRQEAEQATMDYQNAVADQQKADAMLQATRVHLAEMLEVPDDKISQRDLTADTIPIKTPRGGTLIARYITPGMAVNPGAQTFTVSGLKKLWMMAAVYEENLAGLEIGMPVTIRVRAYPDAVFEGQVTQLGPQLDPATRTLTVRVVIPNRDGRLRPEMYATAEIARGASRQALFVPEAAVQSLSGEPVVFVRRGDSEFEAMPVKTGSRVDRQVEIAQGLKDGEEVVTGGAFVVKSQFLTRSLSQ